MTTNNRLCFDRDTTEITEKQKAFLLKNNIPFTSDCDKVTAGRLISDYLQSIPATYKQIDYLCYLGYKGDLKRLSQAQAASEIERLNLKRNNDRVPF